MSRLTVRGRRVSFIGFSSLDPSGGQIKINHEGREGHHVEHFYIFTFMKVDSFVPTLEFNMVLFIPTWAAGNIPTLPGISSHRSLYLLFSFVSVVLFVVNFFYLPLSIEFSQQLVIHIHRVMAAGVAAQGDAGGKGLNHRDARASLVEN